MRLSPSLDWFLIMLLDLRYRQMNRYSRCQERLVAIVGTWSQVRAKRLHNSPAIAPLVRCMDEVVIQSEPEHGGFNAQVLLEHRHGWDRAAFPDIQWLLAQDILKHLCLYKGSSKPLLSCPVTTMIGCDCDCERARIAIAN